MKEISRTDRSRLSAWSAAVFVDQAFFDPEIYFGSSKPNELPEFVERDPAFVNETANERLVDCEVLGECGDIHERIVKCREGLYWLHNITFRWRSMVSVVVRVAVLDTVRDAFGRIILGGEFVSPSAPAIAAPGVHREQEVRSGRC